MNISQQKKTKKLTTKYLTEYLTGGLHLKLLELFQLTLKPYSFSSRGGKKKKKEISGAQYSQPGGQMGHSSVNLL